MKKSNEILNSTITGGDSYCTLLIGTPDEKIGLCSAMLFHHGKYTVYDVEIKIDKLGYMTLNNKKTKSFWDGKIMSRNKPLRLKIRNISGDEAILNLLDQK